MLLFEVRHADTGAQADIRVHADTGSGRHAGSGGLAMSAIKVADAVLGGIRVATSPLWETVGSLMLLAAHRGSAPWPFGNWMSMARRNAGTAPTTGLIEWLGDLGWRLPHWLLPVPSAPRPTMDAECAALLRSPADRICSAIATEHPDGPPDPLTRFVADPVAALAWYVEGLRAHWRMSIEPYWPAMRVALEEEVLAKARVLATEGAEALLTSLPGHLRWHRPNLTVYGITGEVAGGMCAVLVVVPLLFNRTTTLVSVADGVAAVSYQARGEVIFADALPNGQARPPTGPEPADRLATLFGGGRAAVLRALAAPTTTTALAKALGLATSTVSEHLTTLSAAGIVQRRRAGRRVLYELDRTGTALLNLFDRQRPRSSNVDRDGPA